MKIESIDYNRIYVNHPSFSENDYSEQWLLLLIKSSAQLQINEKKISINPNTFVLIKPNTTYNIEYVDKQLVADCLIFTPSNTEEKILNNLPINTPIKINDLADLSFVLRNMCYEFYSLNPYRLENIDLFFMLLLNKLSERLIYYQPPSNINKCQYAKELMQIRKEIYLHPEKKWNIDELATYLPLSRSRFQHLYSQAFGTSITKDIMAVRLKRACELLLSTTIPIYEVANKCGYDSSSYFMRIFKENFKLTPSQYRISQVRKK